MAGSGPLRIIHCVRSPIGGIFRHVADLALAQTEAGHEVGIICDSSTGGSFEAENIARISPQLAHGIRRFPMERRISVRDFRVVLDLLRDLRVLGPDVLHGHGAKGGAYARVIGSLLRVSGNDIVRIYCPHGGSLHFDPQSAEGRTYFRLERMLGSVTDGLVFVSDFEMDTYSRKVVMPSTLTRRIYNGLRADEFEPIVPREGMADLLYAGMMRDLKGPQILIEALHILAIEQGRRPSLRLLGAGEDRAAYEARVAELGLADSISFHDPIPTRQALAQGRILVVPSLAESMPYLILEAIAAHMPVVATRVGGVPEIFAGRSSRLVAPGDAAALAEGIAAVLDQETEARRDASAFAAEIRERFSITKMASEVEALYLEALTPSRPPLPRSAEEPPRTGVPARFVPGRGP